MAFPQPSAPLHGKHVALRPWKPADAAWYVEARDEEVFRWTTEPRTLTVAQVAAAIAANRHNPVHAGLAITDALTGSLVGNIALTVPDPSARRAEVMYWLAQESRGRGFASDAVRVLIEWAFDALPIDDVQLRTRRGNTPSQRVAHSSGFEARGMSGEQLLFVRDRSCT